MIAADLAKLDIFGTDYLFLLYDARLREVCFRSYVTDALGSLAGIEARWVEKAYNLPTAAEENTEQSAECEDTRPASEIAASIIDGLGAILERGDNE